MKRREEDKVFLLHLLLGLRKSLREGRRNTRHTDIIKEHDNVKCLILWFKWPSQNWMIS